jgi:hypothetical protein
MDNTNTIKVAVDLTPLRPGGENGGAKTLMLALLKEFALLQADFFEYLLITEPWNHEEIKQYESTNITCRLRSEIYDETHSDDQPDLEAYSSLQKKAPTSTLKTKVKALAKAFIYAAKPLAKSFLSRSPNTYVAFKRRFQSLSHELFGTALELCILSPHL